MEDSKLGFQATEIKEIKNLFSCLLEDSTQNLNQFICGNSLTVSNATSDDFRNKLKEFLRLAQRIFRKIDNKKKFFKEFEEVPDCDAFMKWLEGYLYDSIRPYEDALFIREIGLRQYEEITKYVFENFILKDIGKEKMDISIATKAQLMCFRKVMFTFIDMLICYNYSKENAISKMDHIFGLEEEKCMIWWNLVEMNEDRLWRIVMMRKFVYMEDKLEQLLEYMQE